MTETLPLLPLILDRLPPGLPLALAQAGVPTVCRNSVRPTGRFVLFDSRATAAPVLEPGQLPVDIDPIRRAFREDPFVALSDVTAATHAWTIGRWELREDCARCDRRNVRERVLSQLRRMIEQAGGVWLCLAPFPFPYRSAFNFRLDYDACMAEDLSRLWPLVDRCPQAFSHYLCASTHEQNYAVLAPLQGHHVGSHGYWHHTYRSYPDNRANVSRGVESLRGAGFDPVGFVAPHGRYNAALAKVLEELHIDHSSEFAAGCDDLPFVPPGRSVLQIPVHPICLGLFCDAARRTVPGIANEHEAVAAAAEYFREVAIAKYEGGEPIFLYGHPDGRIGRYPKVLEPLLEEIAGRPAIWNTTLAQFADWWRQRAAVELRVYREADAYRVSCEQLPRWALALDFHRKGLAARLPVDEPQLRFQPASLVYEPVPQHCHVAARRTVAGAGWKELFRQQLDWETTTPTAEIRDRTWRGWAKWALRHVRGPVA